MAAEQQYDDEYEEEFEECNEPEENPRLEEIRSVMYAPTSDSTLKRMLGGRVNVYTYEELLKFPTLDAALAPYGKFILLYPGSKSAANPNEVGHWVCCWKVPGVPKVCYFDSYASFVDKPLGIEDPKSLRKPNVIPAHLSKLFFESPYSEHDMEWNEILFQSKDKPTNTCGLWCVVRLLNDRLDEQEFRHLYYDRALQHGYAPDLLVATVCKRMFPFLPIEPPVDRTIPTPAVSTGRMLDPPQPKVTEPEEDEDYYNDNVLDEPEETKPTAKDAAADP
jgi:hypothetical protein